MAESTFLDGSDGLQRLGRVAEVFEVAAEDAGIFDFVHHALGFCCGAAEGLGAENRLAGGGGQVYALFVDVVGQADDDGVDVVGGTGFGQICGPVGDTPFLCKSLGSFFCPGINELHSVSTPAAIERHCVEHADQACAQH